VGGAAIGALLALGIVLILATRLRSVIGLLLVGIMLGYLNLGLVALLQYFTNPGQLRQFLAWTYGSMGGVSLDQAGLLALIVVPLLLWAVLLSRPLDLNLLGEDYAFTMGLEMRRYRWQFLVIAGILTGTLTAFNGPVAFIGLATPHVARSLSGTSRHAVLTPASILLGAILLIACDLLAKFPGSASSLPLNAVTSLIGAPVVILIIFRYYRASV
jgi:iron complex transport system permease protein